MHWHPWAPSVCVYVDVCRCGLCVCGVYVYVCMWICVDLVNMSRCGLCVCMCVCVCACVRACVCVSV